MKARLLVSAVGIPFLLAVLIYLPPIATAILAALLSAVAAHELYLAVRQQENNWVLFLLCLIAAAVPILVFLHQESILLSLGALLIVIHFVRMLFAYEQKHPLPFASLAPLFMSAFVIPLAFSVLVILRQMDYGSAKVMIPLVAAFCSDSMALFAGMLLGKHKLSPCVSPKKTVEGCVGGFVGGIIGMIIFRFIAEAACGYILSWGLTILLGAAGSALGQLGDLSFSVIKREFSIKDYGKLLPGHGGVLDRFDSVIFASPVILFLLMLGK